MNKNIEQLAEQRDGLKKRISDKHAAADEVESEMERLIDALLASSGEDREELIEQRVMVAAERDALRDEIAELERRWHRANLAYYRGLEEEARQAYEVARREAGEHRRLLKQKGDDQRRLLHGADVDIPEGKTREEYRADLAAAIARLKVQGQELDRSKSVMQARWKKAQGELENVLQGYHEEGSYSALSMT